MKRFATLGCLMIVLATSPTDAAKPRPFRGRVTATWDNIFNGLFAPPANFVGGGRVSHMGKTIQRGNLVLDPTPNPDGTFNGAGSVVITAANGDRVRFDYVGILIPTTGEGIGTFTFTGGTGRFRDAKGGGDFYALIDLSLPDNQPMSVVLNGRIEY
jgi:hypothetical protein